MPIIHPEVGIKPDPNLVLWRYMELDKFHSLLERKALFFCRADKFADPFEGSLPRVEFDYRPKSQREASAFYGNTTTDEQIAESIAGLTHEHLEFRRRHVVNCWHINSNESDAMWRLYLKSNEGVAIQTTAKRLMSALANIAAEVDISKVRYIDYDKDCFHHARNYDHRSYNLFMPLVHKRNEFVHERELRLIHEVDDARLKKDYWTTQEFEQGMFIEIDLGVLIDKIILPPTSDDAVRMKAENIATSLGYNFSFEKSTLAKPALF